jgi:hypothetical protein
VADLPQLVVYKVKVALLRVAAEQRRRRRRRGIKQRARHVIVPCHERMPWVVIFRRVIPEHELAEAVALAWRARELKRCVHDVRLELQLLVQTGHEERVARGEDGDGQHADGEVAAAAAEEALVGERLARLGERRALARKAARAQLTLWIGSWCTVMRSHSDGVLAWLCDQGSARSTSAEQGFDRRKLLPICTSAQLAHAPLAMQPQRSTQTNGRCAGAHSLNAFWSQMS